MLTQLAGVPVGMVEIIEQLTIDILCKGPPRKELEPTTRGLLVGGGADLAEFAVL